MWGSGDPGEEREGGSNDGLFVAWCLTVAGVLSLVGTVAGLWEYPGFKFSDRVVQYSTMSLFPIALVVAAAVAWSLTDSGRHDGEHPSPARAVAEALIGLAAAVVTVAASVYATLLVLDVRGIGGESFEAGDWPSRVSIFGFFLTIVEAEPAIALPVWRAIAPAVALVARPSRGEPGLWLADRVITVAAFIGLVTVAAAGYSIWRSFTATSSPDRPPFFDINWWSRTAAIAPALAAAGLGAASGYLKRRVVLADRSEPVATPARFDPRLVAVSLLVAAISVLRRASASSAMVCSFCSPQAWLSRP